MARFTVGKRSILLTFALLLATFCSEGQRLQLPRRKKVLQQIPDVARPFSLPPIGEFAIERADSR